MTASTLLRGGLLWALVGSCVVEPAEPAGALLDTSVPAPPAARIEPAAPRARDGLHCLVEDPRAVYVTWTVDGAPFVGAGTSRPGDTVPAGVTRWQEVWECAAWPANSGEPGSAAVTIADPPGGNVLVVVLDDVGLDKVGAYGLHPSPPPTPTLDALAADGLLFTRAYTAPVCSAARANLLTGRYGRRTGVGDTVRPDGEFELPLAELTLPEMLASAPAEWATSAVGKWHLSALGTPTGVDHPTAQGFDWFEGVLGNITEATHLDGTPVGYDHWEKTTNGAQRFVDGYLTSVQIDDAVGRMSVMPEPWLLYLPLSAPHSPLHVPPDSLHSSRADFSQNNKADYYDAMLEAADTELGRLLDGMGGGLRERTTIIVVGDNGTPSHSVRPPWSSERSKATLFDGGVRVPLIVAGPHVSQPGRAVDALVHVVDVFPTVASIAGIFVDELAGEDGAMIPLDGHSWLSLMEGADAEWPRETLYLERFYPNGRPPYDQIDSRAVRDGRYKLVRELDREDRMYQYLGGAVDEGPDLFGAGPLDPEAERAYYRLSRELDRFAAELVYASVE
ncbi:MAG: arylsulfatase A-like enzyme [Myxococcota bacterium]